MIHNAGGKTVSPYGLSIASACYFFVMCSDVVRVVRASSTAGKLPRAKKSHSTIAHVSQGNVSSLSSSSLFGRLITINICVTVRRIGIETRYNGCGGLMGEADRRC